LLALADGAISAAPRNPAASSGIVALRDIRDAPALVDDTSFGLGVKGPVSDPWRRGVSGV
jgi:hypothetical protein